MTTESQFTRHARDLFTDTYEDKASREERFEHYRSAISLATPVVGDVLQSMNRAVLCGTGSIDSDPLPEDSDGNRSFGWRLSWPQQRDSFHRITGKPLEAVTVTATFPRDYTHPHLGEEKPVDSVSIWAWPFQISSEQDAFGLRFIFEAIAWASLHERMFQADTGWRVIGHYGKPPSPQDGAL